MSLFPWLRTRKPSAPIRRDPAREPAPRFRPRLETLEDRIAPATLTVTNDHDHDTGSLRAEIAASHAGDTIRFAPSLDGRTITLTSGELVITRGLTIRGPGTGRLTISGGNTSRVFEVDGAKTNVTLSGLTITRGDGVGGTNSGSGGGIYNDGGNLTISGCTFSGNSASTGAAFGGAIYNLGSLEVSGSALSGNSAGGAGGAIYNGSMFTDGGVQTVKATVSDCTLSSNTALFGGAIENDGTLTVTHSTLSGNSIGPFAGGFGGAIDNNGTATINQSTLSGNSAPFGAGGAISDSGTVTINQSALSGNSADGGQGGAIAVSFNATLTINQSILSDNSADTATYPFNGTVFVGQGGAIFNAGGGVTIDQSILCGNSANGGQGGAISNLDGTMTIRQSILVDNSANGGGFGGGIYNGDSAKLTIRESAVWHNVAALGGDLYDAGLVSVFDSIIGHRYDV